MTTSESKGRFFTKGTDLHNELNRITNWNALTGTTVTTAVYVSGGFVTS